MYLEIHSSRSFNSSSPSLSLANCKRETMHFNWRQTLCCVSNRIVGESKTFNREKNWLFIWSRCNPTLLLLLLKRREIRGRTRCSYEILSLLCIVNKKEFWIHFRSFQFPNTTLKRFHNDNTIKSEVLHSLSLLALDYTFTIIWLDKMWVRQEGVDKSEDEHLLAFHVSQVEGKKFNYQKCKTFCGFGRKDIQFVNRHRYLHLG